MATEYSKEYQQVRFRSGIQSVMLENGGWGAPIRTKRFTIVAGTDATLAQNDVNKLCKMYKGERIVGGYVAMEALGAGVKLSIGDGTTAGKYASAVDGSAAGDFTFGDEIDLGFMDVIATDFDLTLTIGGGSVTATKKLYGYVAYIGGN